MSKQVTIMGCTWTVGRGRVQNPDTGEERDTRVAVMTEVSTGDVFMFPFPEEEGRNFGRVMQADDPDAEMELIKRAQELAVPEMPSPEKLEAMQAAGSGQIPGGPPDRRPKPPHKQ